MLFHDDTNDGSVTDISTASGHLLAFQAYNHDEEGRYVQFFNQAAASVTVGTTTPLFHLFLPPTGGNSLAFPVPFTRACSYAVTTARGGATGPTTDAEIFALYE